MTQRQSRDEMQLAKLRELHSEFKGKLNDTLEKRERAQKQRFERLREDIRDKAKEIAKINAVLDIERAQAKQRVSEMEQQHSMAIKTRDERIAALEEQIETTKQNDLKQQNEQIEALVDENNALRQANIAVLEMGRIGTG